MVPCQSFTYANGAWDVSGTAMNFAHVEGDGEPRHMLGLPREKTVHLMRCVAEGRRTEVEKEPWSSGY